MRMCSGEAATMEDSQARPLRLEIKPNSLDDGPGIRTVIFFKGCPLDCVWCQNPEAKSRHAELSYDRLQCVKCLSCVKACSRGALDPDDPAFVDRARCTLCFSCTKVCPSGALERVGTPMGIDEILRKILPDKPFFDTSGGGVTLSGGEPTLFMETASKLAKVLKEKGIHVLVETCGLFDLGLFRASLLPYIDEIFFDLKIFDNREHLRLCGADNRIILSNFKFLFGLSLSGGVPVLPRIPLVPGMTDTEGNITALGAFLKDLGCTKVSLLPYNPLWTDKCAKLGRPVPNGLDRKRQGWYEKERLASVKEVLERFGIADV